jgi:transposase
MEATVVMKGTGGLVAPERSDSERSELSRSGGVTSPRAAEGQSSTGGTVRDPEVSAKATRRQYSAAYKRKILAEADECGAGGVSALLRREGLYSSHLKTWRKQRESGEIAGLEPRKRGRKAAPRNPLAAELASLQKENLRLQKRLRKAEIIIDVQKKLCEILGLPVATVDEDGNVE